MLPPTARVAMTVSEYTQGAPLSARLAELVDYNTGIRQQLESFVESVPSSLQHQRVEPDGWTLAESIEHLCLIEDSVGRLISSMAKRLRADNAHEAGTSSMLGSLDQFNLTSSKSKLSAPEPYRPTGSLSATEALAKLRAIRVRVLEGVQKANGLDLTKASFPHPYFGPMDGYQWLLMIGQHELRHLDQMTQSVQQLTTGPLSSAPVASQGSL